MDSPLEQKAAHLSSKPGNLFEFSPIAREYSKKLSQSPN